ncbi:MAG TPA: hypothetical protein VHB79_26135 [Polyangiaceae bacterium]|nr:hypothetical protein [Polyangiaceae bacterium]
MLVRYSLRFAPVWLAALPLLAIACGGDDQKEPTTVVVQDNDGGAPPSYPPALSPEDCVDTISSITLSQPEGAAVWGGLVVLEFTAEGSKLDSFDVQLYDSALGAWTNYYVNVQAQGQREDGSYFMAVSPYFSDATKDEPMKLRVRPSQQGCPDATWTETEEFTAADPLLGTTWKADIPAGSLNSQLTLLRNEVPGGGSLPQASLTVGDSSIQVEFGKKGAFTETVSIPLHTDTDLPWDGCRLGLTFTGTYSLKLRQQYGGISLAVSEQQLTSFAATKCELPSVEEMAFSAENASMTLNAFNTQVSIGYLGTLYQKPEAPTWQNAGFGQIYQQLIEFLSYTTATETGYVNGYANVQDLTLTQQ